MTMTTNTIPTFKELVEFIKDVPNIDHEAVSLVRKAEEKSNIAQFGVLEELAEWLGATLVEDDWRPVKLKKGIYFEGELEFFD